MTHYSEVWMEEHYGDHHPPSLIAQLEGQMALAHRCQVSCRAEIAERQEEWQTKRDAEGVDAAGNRPSIDHELMERWSRDVRECQIALAALYTANNA